MTQRIFNIFKDKCKRKDVYTDYIKFYGEQECGLYYRTIGITIEGDIIHATVSYFKNGKYVTTILSNHYKDVRVIKFSKFDPYLYLCRINTVVIS